MSTCNSSNHLGSDVLGEVCADGNQQSQDPVAGRNQTVLSCIKISSRASVSAATKLPSDAANSKNDGDSCHSTQRNYLPRISKDFSIIENPVSDIDPGNCMEYDNTDGSHNKNCSFQSSNEVSNSKSQLLHSNFHDDTQNGDLQLSQDYVSSCSRMNTSTTNAVGPLSSILPSNHQPPNMCSKTSKTIVPPSQSNNDSLSYCGGSNSYLNKIDNSLPVEMESSEVQGLKLPQLEQTSGVCNASVLEKSYSEEPANIQANLLAHFDSYSDYVYRSPFLESSDHTNSNDTHVGTAKNSLQRSNSESSPCITDVDGKTGFMVGDRKSSLVDKSIGTKKKTYGRSNSVKSQEKVCFNTISSNENNKNSEKQQIMKKPNIGLSRSKSLTSGREAVEVDSPNLRHGLLSGSEGSISKEEGDQRAGFASILSR